MRKLTLAAAAAVAFLSAPAFAQDPADAPVGEPAAPDGSRAFGIEPYVGVMGGYEWFDNQRTDAGIPQPLRGHYDGALIQGRAGC